MGIIEIQRPIAIDPGDFLLARRRTKIIATLGPSSSDPEVIARLIEAGVDVFRLNFSHGDLDWHRTVYGRVRAASEHAAQPVAVLADLAGPKIRVGRFDGGHIELSAGRAVTVTTRDVVGNETLIPSQYAALAADVRPGDRILFADGVMEALVETVRDTEVDCTVVRGGVLSDRKGINLPGVNLSATCITEKDVADARLALELGCDFLGLSFTRRASDVESLRVLISESGHDAGVISKIERPEALDDIDRILDLSDAIMVARGDLGVELPFEQVPVVQNQLIDRARARRKAVIVATQMLETMIENPRPTRAEASDVAHAVIAGVDAVMLSGETASGDFPVLAVETMDRINRQTEAYLWRRGAFGTLVHDDVRERPIPAEDAIALSTAQLSRDLRVRAIVVVSHNGMSAATVSSARPAAPVITVSASERICRRMSLLWGTVPIRVDPEDLIDPIPLCRRLPQELGLAEPGQFVLLVGGFDAEPDRNAPSITVLAL